jgi:hypothetical protein
METAMELSGAARIGEPSASIIRVAASLPPRDLVLVEKNIRGALQNNPAMAEVCIYCRPVGKKDGKQQFAVGPSIRFTELGQQCFGRLWLNGTVDQDARRVTATFMCFDLSTMNITFGTSSKSIIKSGGDRMSENMVEVITNAALSIARRNALTQQMRPQLEACMVDAKNAAIKKWSDKLDAKEAMNLLLADYKKRWGTTEAQLKALVENENTPEDKLMLVIGVRNYLIDNPDGYSDVFAVAPNAGAQGKEPPKQTEKQRYNTLRLQIEAAGNAVHMAEAIAEFQGRIAKGEKEFDEDDYKNLISVLEKYLHPEVKK